MSAAAKACPQGSIRHARRPLHSAHGQRKPINDTGAPVHRDARRQPSLAVGRHPLPVQRSACDQRLTQRLPATADGTRVGDELAGPPICHEKRSWTHPPGAGCNKGNGRNSGRNHNASWSPDCDKTASFATMFPQHIFQISTSRAWPPHPSFTSAAAAPSTASEDSRAPFSAPAASCAPSSARPSSSLRSAASP